MKILGYTLIAIFSFLMVFVSIAPPCSGALAPSELSSNAAFDSRDWHGMRVLHIGDSHLENWGLKGTLRRKFTQAGAVYNVSAWKGSSSRSWLRTGKLSRLLREKSPNVVIINLGTNISRSKDPQQYAKYVKRLVEKIAPRECYWVAPPPLIEDSNGYYQMLETASKPCVFLDSRKIEFDAPHKKYFHLSKRQSILWAEKIWEWMNAPSSFLPESADGV